MAADFAPAYAASKVGIVQLTHACATGWAREHIQVNVVLPRRPVLQEQLDRSVDAIAFATKPDVRHDQCRTLRGRQFDCLSGR